MRCQKHTSSLFALFVFLLSGTAEAYIGPGAGLSVIGTVLALIGALLLGIVGFVWYPIKRLRARLKKTDKPEKEESEEQDKKDDSP